ncbi:uncharacterized protein BP5553_01369 [Venustampulla echinocandica]|uniref:Inner membrane assembly complex subunit 17 n=1 Tax=Venustampulla echinocandica TaxID=2656787 RepID=A0A370U0S9_9HELO|nr:uncharacterized protein BP5553_01369 [Venustampulla echinocandica]RDL41390.1 hypothetical protein BP5553_01369 [Venustampulla echinocandica]
MRLLPMSRFAASIRAAPICMTTSTPSRRGIPHIRLNSTDSQPKPSSPTTSFYKTFTRPVAKVLLMATFTYQLAYWAWVKLEKDEIKAQRSAEITELEAQLTALTEDKKIAKTNP